MSKVLVRATNWLGDAVMSLPAIRAIRQVFPRAHIAIAARPWVADLYARETSVDSIIPYTGSRREYAFDAALIAWMARIPERIGYNRDARGLLLTRAIPVPEPGEIPRHERFYYLELLRRAGLIERFPPTDAIRLEGIEVARDSGARHLAELGIALPVIGISPGAAYGNAKRWLPDRFAEVARAFQTLSAAVLVFGSASERPLCEEVAGALRRDHIETRNLAGQTTLREFIDLAAACRLFLSNDSGAMHVASALAVPTVAVFGATDDATTGPTGPLARVVREHAECSPCLLRDCPIDHRCMTRVTADKVAAVALELWTHEAKS
jgi:heptosyltransferase-2